MVSAALKLVDEVGVQAFSLRMLADVLESGTATLYRHFASKDELMAYVVDRVLGEVHVTGQEDFATWQDAITAGAEAFYETLRRHLNVLPLLMAQVPVGPNGLANRERLIQLLLGHGFPVELAARAFTAIGHYVVGFAVQQHGPGSAGPESGPQLLDFYRHLDPATYPATTSAAEELTTVPLEEEFRFGLRLIIKGLESGRDV
ncbi:TetR/AcrR family transcriptional regulator [Streptomyces sp. NPDC051104]|uniref:TetR/AcrR family transcriptional regulator n=1 Tax=Streptomyces sp. NPDC051104 TaxID=3155044 RepID=UPI0034281B31